jgi:hypothetical protein
MTLAQAQREVSRFSTSLRLVKDYNYGEFQVRVKGLPEATYFTDCIEDAVNTARSMAREIASHFGGRA